jgi:hypothetical protein
MELPADTPEGCYVPLQARVGSLVSNSVTIAVNRNGGACSEPDNAFFEALRSGARIGVVNLVRELLDIDVDVFTPARFTLDLTHSYFREERRGDNAFNPLFSLPSPGTCTAYAFGGDLDKEIPYFYTSRGLDAGNITLSGPAGTKTADRTTSSGSTHYPITQIGGPAGISQDADDALHLNPGVHTVGSSGGTDIGPINGSATVSSPSVWTNRSALERIARSAGVRFDWQPGTSQRFAVAGYSVDKTTNASGVFLCIPPRGATTFQVPAVYLANLPASRPALLESAGYLLLLELNSTSPQPFSAQGLNFGATMVRFQHMKKVRFE